MGSDVGLEVGGGAAALLREGPDGLLGDARDRAAPAGVRDGEAAGSADDDGNAIGEAQEHGDVGGRADDGVGAGERGLDGASVRRPAGVAHGHDAVPVHLVRDHEVRGASLGPYGGQGAAAVLRNGGRVVAAAVAEVERGVGRRADAARALGERERDPARGAGVRKQGHAALCPVSAEGSHFSPRFGCA